MVSVSIAFYLCVCGCVGYQLHLIQSISHNYDAVYFRDDVDGVLYSSRDMEQAWACNVAVLVAGNRLGSFPVQVTALYLRLFRSLCARKLQKHERQAIRIVKH